MREGVDAKVGHALQPGALDADQSVVGLGQPLIAKGRTARSGNHAYLEIRDGQSRSEVLGARAEGARARSGVLQEGRRERSVPVSVGQFTASVRRPQQDHTPERCGPLLGEQRAHHEPAKRVADEVNGPVARLAAGRDLR